MACGAIEHHCDDTRAGTRATPFEAHGAAAHRPGRPPRPLEGGFSGGLTASLSVTYDGNTHTGGAVPVDAGAYASGATVTVLGNTGALVKTGYTFAGWNTAANGSGTSYAGGATFTMGSANVTLYAKWTPSCTYSISPQSSPSVSSIGESGNVNVTAPSGCNWTVTSNAGSTGAAKTTKGSPAKVAEQPLAVVTRTCDV